MKLKGLLKAFSLIFTLLFLQIVGMYRTAEAEVSITVLTMSDQTRSMMHRLKFLIQNYSLENKDVPAYIEKLKKNYSLAFPQDVQVKNTLTSKKYGDNPVYSLKSGKKQDTAVIYIYGGAFAFNISPKHIVFCDRLADVLNADVHMPLYSLIPYGTYKEAFQVLDSLYEDLLKEYKKICIMGDAAGGNISITYTMHRKDKKMVLPYKVVAFSPLVDMSRENPEILKYVNQDKFLKFDGLYELMQLWRADIEVKQWQVSPLYGDLKGLPGVLLFFAQNEIFYPDGIKFYNKLQEAGNDVKLVIGNEHFFIFPLFDIPEQKECLRMIKECCK